MRNKNKKFSISLLLSVLFASIFFVWPAPAQGSLMGDIKAYVSASLNPLEVRAKAPKRNSEGELFYVKAKIKNGGERNLKKVKAEIMLPPEIELMTGEQEYQIGTLKASKKKTVRWRVRGNEMGNFIIAVKASGKLDGNTVITEDSVKVKITQRKWWYWWEWRIWTYASRG